MDGIPTTVESVRSVGPGTVAIDLETPSNFAAVPGQFILVRAAPTGEELARHYTISSPSIEETFEITVGVDPDGDLSPWLGGLEGGETVHIEGPFGTIRYERDADVVAVAGGPGIGAALATAEAAIEADHGAVVIYQADAIAHRNRLADLTDAGATVELLEGADRSGLHRAVANHRTEGVVYAFGFEPFVRAVASAIEAAGADPADAHFENFG